MMSCLHSCKLFSLTVVLFFTLSCAFPRGAANWSPAGTDVHRQPFPLINSLFSSLLRARIRHRDQLRGKSYFHIVIYHFTPESFETSRHEMCVNSECVYQHPLTNKIASRLGTKEGKNFFLLYLNMCCRLEKFSCSRHFCFQMESFLAVAHVTRM